MSMTEVIKEAILWLAWGGAGLAVLTLIAFLISWKAKFQLTGATIFTLLLSASCWAFEKSYIPPVTVEGYTYAPIVYDNGFDLVVAQASDDFPEESIKPTLLQIAGNLKGGGRNGAKVNVRLRKIEEVGEGISKPIILGEVIKDLKESKIIEVPKRDYSLIDDSIDEINKNNYNLSDNYE